MFKVFNFVLVVLFISLITKQVMAGEQGHYSAAPIAVRDYAMPPKGFYVNNYNTFYLADEIRNTSGDKVETLSSAGTATRNISIGSHNIPVTLTGAFTANLDPDVKAFYQTPVFVWVTDKKFLGADYGMLIAPSWGQMRVKVKADVSAAGTLQIGENARTFAGATSIEVKDDKTGMGDLLVQPFWLGWRGKNHDLAFNYAFYAPTGAYDKDDLANVGYGFWTHRAQGNAYYYPFENKATAFMITPTYEWHSEKTDKDVQPGQNFTLEYGISQYLHPQFELGVSGYQGWQISSDSGSAAVVGGKNDVSNGVGGQATWWVLKEKCALVGKYSMEYGVKDRTAGQFGSLNLTWIF